MATLGGNVLQRTRCPYFLDTSWTACNKRDPGSGCTAMDGLNRQHAILGGSRDCRELSRRLCPELIALDATVSVAGPAGVRTILFSALHRLPGATPNVETVLAPGDLITEINVPGGPWTRRSLYLKIRDRQSYEFALASAVVAIDMVGPKVREARIALGGIATIPWRSQEAEDVLAGQNLTETVAEAAARAAFADARPRIHNAFKVALGRATLVRALLQAAELEG
jgi:xanthine dehydrogenase YagS FAD-binding subunit